MQLIGDKILVVLNQYTRVFKLAETHWLEKKTETHLLAAASMGVID